VKFWKSKEVVFWEVTGSVVASKRATITETERKESGNFEDMMIVWSFDSILMSCEWACMLMTDIYTHYLLTISSFSFGEYTEVVVQPKLLISNVTSTNLISGMAAQLPDFSCSSSYSWQCFLAFLIENCNCNAQLIKFIYNIII